MIRKILRDESGHLTASAARPPIAASHLRKDAWWALPLTVFIVLGSFVVYSTWAGLQNAHYYAAPYLSPLYSPCLSASCLHATFGGGLPDIQVPIIGVLSPAFLILWGPGFFRLSCYYYRKAYYRSFWLAPVACGVPDARTKYTGETKFPLTLQAFHRYTWYVAVLFIVFLTWDGLLAFRFPVEGGGHHFGIGVGTVVLWVNDILLALYTFSCHSCRHVCGGHANQFSKAPTRYKLWHWITELNEKHPTFAWLSLLWVGFTDVYIRLVSMGIVHDFRVIF
jgi:hypothetical protein